MDLADAQAAAPQAAGSGKENLTFQAEEQRRKVTGAMAKLTADAKKLDDNDREMVQMVTAVVRLHDRAEEVMKQSDGTMKNEAGNLQHSTAQYLQTGKSSDLMAIAKATQRFDSYAKHVRVTPGEGVNLGTANRLVELVRDFNEKLQASTGREMAQMRL